MVHTCLPRAQPGTNMFRGNWDSLSPPPSFGQHTHTHTHTPKKKILASATCNSLSPRMHQIRLYLSQLLGCPDERRRSPDSSSSSSSHLCLYQYGSNFHPGSHHHGHWQDEQEGIEASFLPSFLSLFLLFFWRCCCLQRSFLSSPLLLSLPPLARLELEQLPPSVSLLPPSAPLARTSLSLSLPSKFCCSSFGAGVAFALSFFLSLSPLFFLLWRCTEWVLRAPEWPGRIFYSHVWALSTIKFSHS